MNELEAATLIKIIVEGMNEIVSQGVFHRDLKPENIAIKYKYLSELQRYFFKEAYGKAMHKLKIINDTLVILILAI